MPRTPSHWQYIDKNCPTLLDPRLKIVQQTNWQSTNKETSLFGIEPNNYNFAIYDNRPHDIKFIKDQCWYKIDQIFRRDKIKGWISVYVIQDRDLTIRFNQEIIKIQPRAVWRYDKFKPVKPRRPLLERENAHKPRSDTNFNTEERLWQLGYFEKLQNKYFYDNDRFVEVVGTPRGAVLNPIYQEDDSEADYCDN